MEHTKEPWRLGRFTGPKSYEEVRETVGNMDVVVDTENGPYVLAACNINFPEDARANAKRIVSCVNACEGISDEALDSWLNPPEGGFGHPHGPWPAHIISLQRAAETAAQQRDELLDLCRQLYEAEQAKNQQDWTAVIRALEKIGAAGTVHNAIAQGREHSERPAGAEGCASSSPYDLVRCPKCGHEAPHHYAGCSEAR